LCFIKWCTGTRHFSGHWFFQFQGKLPITSQIIFISTKLQNKSCITSKDAKNGDFTKIQSPYLITYEFSNMVMEKTSHDTITDSSLWDSLHKNGSFLLQINDEHKKSLFFLLLFKSNMNSMWWPGPEIFMP
jgi:hypothetical protein